jgi:chemotaxis protein CheX
MAITAFNGLDIQACVSTSLMDVFDTMFSMPVEVSPNSSPISFNGNDIVGSVSFAGDVIGTVQLHLNSSFARLMTAAMLDTTPEEIDGEEDVDDVVAEVSNMIGGNLKSKLCDAGYPCVLSVPSVTRGARPDGEPPDGHHHEALLLRHHEYCSLVLVSIRL